MARPGRTRRLVVLAFALVIVAGLVVADAVTMSKAKPSFVNETRAFQNLLKSATTTTLPSRKPVSSTSSTSSTSGTSSTSSSSNTASSSSTASTSGVPGSSTSP